MTRISTVKLVCLLLFAVLVAAPAWGQSGNYRHQVTIYDDNQGKNLSGPTGVACEGDRVVVADSKNSRLLFYSSPDNPIVTNEIKLPRKVRPTIVQFGSGGSLLVYDSRAKEILRFNPDGKTDGKVNPANVPGNSRIIPKSFRTDGSGNIYLLDIFGRRVVILDPTGDFKRQITFPREFGFISDLAVDGGGRVFILDSVRSQVLSAKPEDGTFLPLSETLKDDLVYPTHMEVDTKGLFYIVDEESSSVGILRKDGSFAERLFNRGRKEGLLYYPSQICVGDGKRIVLADRDNNRVQVFKEKE